MANTLTGLLQTIYDAQRRVSREMIGMIPAVSKDAKAEMVTLNQPIRSPVVPAFEIEDIAASNVSDTGQNRDVNYIDLEITKQKKVSFHITGEEAKGLMAGGTMSDIDAQSFEQAFRALGNAIETDLCLLHRDASRAYGTVGTVPFGEADKLQDLSQVRKILDDNGAPPTTRSMVLNTTASANLRGLQPSVFRVNEDGSPAGRRQGSVGTLFNMDIGESVQFTQYSALGDATMNINKAGGYPIGTTELTIDTGGATENYNKGDIVTLAGDSNKYLVAEDSGDNPTTVKIQEPGLREPAQDDDLLTIGAAYTPSLAFTRDAFHLACRVPALPPGGDSASDREYIMDPISGLVYEVAMYRQYRQLTVEIGICWGVKAINPAHSAILIS